MVTVAFVFFFLTIFFSLCFSLRLFKRRRSALRARRDSAPRSHLAAGKNAAGASEMKVFQIEPRKTIIKIVIKKEGKKKKNRRRKIYICHNPYRQVQAESSEYIAGRGGELSAARSAVQSPGAALTWARSDRRAPFRAAPRRSAPREVVVPPAVPAPSDSLRHQLSSPPVSPPPPPLPLSLRLWGG